MTLRTTALLAALAALPACGLEGGVQAPAGAQLLVPEDVAIAWDDAFNGYDDGVGALVPVDLMVYDGTTGEALGYVSLEVASDSDGVLVVGRDEIEIVDPEDCADCSWHWDLWRDQYFAFADGVESDEVEARAAITTDADGLARIYLFVDAFPLDDEDYTVLPVVVSTGATEESFLLVPR